MGLESGDYGIEETLRIYFRNEYQYINKLADYLRQWVRTIKIKDTLPITSKIEPNNDFFITFNYTSVLESVYNITSDKVLHIHGSLHNHTDDPILGHGNKNRMEDIKAKRNHAQISRNEKEVSICTVIEDYYKTTFKNVNNYMHKLNTLYKYNPEKIIVLGHSVAGIDLPYFARIDEFTDRKAIWEVYFYDATKKDDIQNALLRQGISIKRIKTSNCNNFYDLIK